MRVCITGVNGFVGRATYSRLISMGHECVGFTRADNTNAFLPVGDIGSATVWTPLLAGAETLIHLAARVHVISEKLPSPLAAFRHVNVQGTLRLAASAAEAGVKRFVFISSAKVNGESTPVGKPFTETDIANPQDAYAVSKREAEQGLARIAQQTGLEVVIIRPPLVYGPGVKANFAVLMRAVQRGIPLPFGAIQNARSLVGLDNLVDFVALCISHPAAANETFLVSDGQDISTSHLVRTMAEAAGVADRQIPVPVPCLQWLGKMSGKSAVVDRLCGSLQLDISKAKTLLSWAPPVSLQQGIRRTMVARQTTFSV